jgi:RNA polymerase sigma-70 factor, ECF subfamily
VDDEAALVAEARGGSVDAFSRLVEIHQGRVRSFIGRFIRNPNTMDDIAQDVFLAAFRNLANYHGESSVSTWLLGIARNRALAFLRDDMRRKNRETERFATVFADLKHDHTQRELEDLELAELEISALEECVKGLPQQSATLLEQHYYKARSSSEIARSSGRSESAVRMTLLRIRHALRECIQKRMAAAEGA